MAACYAGFVDVGFLRAEGARLLGERINQVRPDASGVVAWLRELDAPEVGGQRFLRAYWYDGAFEVTHPEHQSQRRFLDAIAFTPGLQLRLGHIAERQSRLRRPVIQALRSTATGLGLNPEELLAEFGKHWTFYPERQQKGVDTLIALDLVRLAQRNVYETAVLVTGDRDLAEAVRTAQDAGKQIVVATPAGQNLAKELCQLADAVLELDTDVVRRMLRLREADTCHPA